MKRNRLFTAVLILMLAVLSGCAEPAAVSPESRPVSVAEYGDQIYYLNGVGVVPGDDLRYDVLTGSLCRMNRDGSNRTVVVPMCVASFQFAGDSVYIIAALESGDYEIGLFSLQSGTYEKLDTMVAGVFQCVGSHLYYTREEGLVRTDLRGRGKRVLTGEAVTSTTLQDNLLFYTSENGLFRIDLNTLRETCLYGNAQAYIIGHTAGRVFAVTSDDNALRAFDPQTGTAEVMIFSAYDEYLISEDGKTAYCAGDSETGSIRLCDMETGLFTVLTDDFASNLLLNGPYLYYTNKSDNNFLYRVRLDGGGTELVSATVPLSGSVCILGEWLYYISPNEGNRAYRIHTQTRQRECLSYYG